MKTKYTRLFTTATPDYDYGTTRPGSPEVGYSLSGSGKQTPLREIFVPEELVEYQVGRNSSGLYMTYTNEQIVEEEKHGFLVIF